jgi:hypothetical protein
MSGGKGRNGNLIPLRGWSLYGAQRGQSLATGGKSRQLESGQNKAKMLPPVATGW